MTIDDHHIRTLVIKERRKWKESQKKEKATSDTSAEISTGMMEQQKAPTLLERLKGLLGITKH